MRQKNGYWIVLIWIVLMAISFLWDYITVNDNTQNIIKNKAQSSFNQILVTRSWNSLHGGVYVPITEKTQPNPYLKDSLRDVVTTNGLHLTEINPAYMTRQISELDSSEHNLRFHITSLRPLRPANKADKWETKALISFEKGTKEKLDLVKTDTGNYYRYMAPLFTEKSCLKCHAIQGYKLGDIRGGISITFPSAVYDKAKKKHLFNLLFVHLLLLMVGLFAINQYFKMSKKYVKTIEAKNTNLKVKQYTIEKANEALQQSNAEKDKFYSVIAHDLRSPFVAIKGFAELISDNIKENNLKNIEEYSDALSKSSGQALLLLDDLLSWSRVNSGRMIFTPKEFSLNEIIDESTQYFNDTIKQKSITIQKDIIKKINVFADKSMISTVLRNLISNAIKFSFSGGKIVISCSIEGNQATVSVKDTGVGIPDNVISKLFDTDSHYTIEGTEKEKGTGLGLILCKEFIDKHQTKIWVESEEGKGSTFYFTLPYRPTEENNIQFEESNKAKKLNVLIVDKDIPSLHLLNFMLQGISRNIILAESGIEAIMYCELHNDIDLILMDIRMPEMDGIETTIKIREKNKNVIIVAQTAFEEEIKNIKDKGFNDYITKPIKSKELIKINEKYFKSF